MGDCSSPCNPGGFWPCPGEAQRRGQQKVAADKIVSDTCVKLPHSVRREPWGARPTVTEQTWAIRPRPSEGPEARTQGVHQGPALGTINGVWFPRHCVEQGLVPTGGWWWWSCHRSLSTDHFTRVADPAKLHNLGSLPYFSLTLAVPPSPPTWPLWTVVVPLNLLRLLCIPIYPCLTHTMSSAPPLSVA